MAAARMNTTTMDPMFPARLDGSRSSATPSYVPGNAAAVNGKATPPAPLRHDGDLRGRRRPRDGRGRRLVRRLDGVPGEVDRDDNTAARARAAVRFPACCALVTGCRDATRYKRAARAGRRTGSPEIADASSAPRNSRTRPSGRRRLRRAGGARGRLLGDRRSLVCLGIHLAGDLSAELCDRRLPQPGPLDRRIGLLRSRPRLRQPHRRDGLGSR